MRSSLISSVLFAAAAIAAPLETRQAACKPIIMIYARGTWEPGSPPEQVAAPLIKALDAKYPGKVDARIVQYDGGAAGYLTGGDAAGTNTMVQMTQAAVSQCPDSKILEVGYSQGAQLLHKALAGLAANVKDHIKAVVVFGDPNKGQPINGISSNIMHTECYDDDMVCNGLPLPIGAHNEYDKRIDAVTEWIVQTLGNV